MLYRTVKTDIWRDPWFHDLAPQSKCLFLYLFTNPSVSACGSMEISIGQIAFDTKMPAKKVEAELQAFGEKVAWWPERNLLIVRNFYKHQRSQSSANFAIAAKKALGTLPDAARVWLWNVYPELKEGMETPKDTHPQPIPNPSPTQGDKEEALATVVAEALATGDTPPNPPEGDDDAADDDDKSIYSAEFERFWTAYPLKKSKGAAWRRWQKVKPRPSTDVLIEAVDAQKRSFDWTKDHGAYIPHPSTWLNARGWEDEVRVPPGQLDADAAFEAWKRGAAVAPELRRVS